MKKEKKKVKEEVKKEEKEEKPKRARTSSWLWNHQSILHNVLPFER